MNKRKNPTEKQWDKILAFKTSSQRIIFKEGVHIIKEHNMAEVVFFYDTVEAVGEISRVDYYYLTEVRSKHRNHTVCI